MTFLRFFPSGSGAGGRWRGTSYVHARRAPFAAMLILMVALAGACGGNATPGGQGSPTGAGTSPGTTGSPTGSGATSPSPSSTKPGPTVTATPSGKGTGQPGSTATLDLACVRRGVDTQGITVHTQPGGPASYNTIYSDGSGAGDGKSTYQTGYGVGAFADATGTYRDMWIVPAEAPPGVATVYVPTQDGRLELKFTVVDQSATCPA